MSRYNGFPHPAQYWANPWHQPANMNFINQFQDFRNGGPMTQGIMNAFAGRLVRPAPMQIQNGRLDPRAAVFLPGIGALNPNANTFVPGRRW